MSDINIVKEWFRYSHNDLISARHLFEDLHPKQTEIASYLSQQCAEKALKGFLIYTALGMEILSSGRYKNIGEQLKVLRNKGSRFFLMFSVGS